MGARRLVLAAAIFTLLAATSVSNGDIIHRYSFNGNTTDSVGGEDGILMGNAFVDSSQLQLDGSDSTYLFLPITDTIGNLTSMTIEGWATWNDPNSFWTRIFDFGNGPLENAFLTPRAGANGTPLRYAITIGGSGGEQDTTAFGPFPVGVSTHFAVTVDKDFGITALYVNGKPVCIEFGDPITLFDFNAPPANCYIGKSQYGADAYYTGSIDEFRIYNNALSADDVHNSYLNGPDAP
jgi:hypothetical protein